MRYELDDILDSSRVQELLIQFRELTGLHSGIVDAKGVLRANSGAPAKCVKWFKKHNIPNFICAALEPEKVLSNLPESGHRLVEAGHGLYYGVHPIHLHGELAGALYVCQFRLNLVDKDTDKDTGTLLLNDTPRLNLERMDQIMAFFSSLVTLLTDMGLSRTELADREIELRRERLRFEALFQASADPIVLLDTGRNIVDLNAAAERQFGRTREEAVGHHASIMHISPKRAEEFGRVAYTAMARQGFWKGEWPLRKSNGDTFIGDVAIAALTLDNGQALGFVSVLRDVTARKRLEEEREMALAEMEAIYENSLMGIALVRDRVFTRINRHGAAIFGYRPEELEGINTLEIYFTREQFEEAGRLCDEALAEQGWFNTEENMRRKDGNGVWVRSYAKPLDPKAPNQGIIWAFDDVTEHKRLEDSLAKAKEFAERASHSKSLFLANMSHEIRTPLSGVLSMLQLVQEETVSTELKEHLAAALSAGNSLLTVVGDVIDLSRVESGNVELAREPLDPAALVKDVLEAFRPQARQKGVRLDSDAGTGVALVLGDEGRMRQIVFNLVSNALKHTDSGQVLVSMRLRTLPGDSRRLQICVADTGEGIPEDQLDQIFRTFVRAKGKTTRREGSGLGLAIVRNLIELMRGEVHMESAPDRGSTACLSVPMRKADKARIRAREARLRTPDPAAPDKPLVRSDKRILVAEDNRVNQIAVRRFLERRGYEVECVSDGAQAVAAVQKGGFGLVLMDIQMPDMDGEEATLRIRKLDKGKDLPIVALTAYAMKGDRERFLERGMNDYLPKPVDLDQLAETVARWSGRSATPAETGRGES